MTNYQQLIEKLAVARAAWGKAQEKTQALLLTVTGTPEYQDADQARKDAKALIEDLEQEIKWNAEQEYNPEYNPERHPHPAVTIDLVMKAELNDAQAALRWCWQNGTHFIKLDETGLLHYAKIVADVNPVSFVTITRDVPKAKIKVNLTDYLPAE